MVFSAIIDTRRCAIVFVALIGKLFSRLDNGVNIGIHFGLCTVVTMLRLICLTMFTCAESRKTDNVQRRDISVRVQSQRRAFSHNARLIRSLANVNKSSRHV